MPDYQKEREAISKWLLKNCEVRGNMFLKKF